MDDGLKSFETLERRRAFVILDRHSAGIGVLFAFLSRNLDIKRKQDIQYSIKRRKQHE